MVPNQGPPHWGDPAETQKPKRRARNLHAKQKMPHARARARGNREAFVWKMVPPILVTLSEMNFRRTFVYPPRGTLGIAGLRDFTYCVQLCLELATGSEKLFLALQVPVPMQPKSPDANVLLYFMYARYCGIGTGGTIGTSTNAAKVAGCMCFTILCVRAKMWDWHR